MPDMERLVLDKILRQRKELDVSEAADLKTTKIEALLKVLASDEKWLAPFRSQGYFFVSDLCLANNAIWKSFGLPQGIETKLRAVCDSVLVCLELHSPTPRKKGKRQRSVSARTKQASDIASRLNLNRRQKSLLRDLFISGGRVVEEALLRFESGNLEPVRALLSDEKTNKRIDISNQMSVDMDALCLLGSNGGSLTLDGGSVDGSLGGISTIDELEDPKPLQEQRGSAMSVGLEWSNFLYDENDMDIPVGLGVLNNKSKRLGSVLIEGNTQRKMSWEEIGDDDDDDVSQNHDEAVAMYSDEEDINLFVSFTNTSSSSSSSSSNDRKTKKKKKTTTSRKKKKKKENTTNVQKYDKQQKARAVERYLEKRQRRSWNNLMKEKEKKPRKRKSNIKPATSPIAPSPADKLSPDDRKKYEAWNKEFLRAQKKQHDMVMREIRKKEKVHKRFQRRNLNQPLVKLVCAGTAVPPSSPIVSERSS